MGIFDESQAITIEGVTVAALREWSWDADTASTVSMGVEIPAGSLSLGFDHRPLLARTLGLNIGDRIWVCGHEAEVTAFTDDGVEFVAVLPARTEATAGRLISTG